ncbi:uncharacterized protein LY89DRAFT_781246 [Mollisia scopiformis]|uniref:Uncharacterized protein n=1 Tax=Mollisia scopiformis TaxID=149040 RepID=A0A194XEH5_MOLSC|nr:uncharacterized protein LY89DRAFT_781246 [Mollisia scopiformis]KUJ18157.1 hypothetical protein LY89DRAFT_781246 [Mollisia scopiformis]
MQPTSIHLLAVIAPATPIVAATTATTAPIIIPTTMGTTANQATPATSEKPITHQTQTSLQCPQRRNLGERRWRENGLATTLNVGYWEQETTYDDELKMVYAETPLRTHKTYFVRT